MSHTDIRMVRGLYLPSLDGLRFIAFCVVLIHHLPLFPESRILTALWSYGWVGVELFFVISSYLFFHLLGAEHRKAGRISYVGFYIRRILRIYPLMIGFPILMIAIYGVSDGFAWYRLIALALFSDNAVAWISGYNVSIPNVAHLWSLSFEFQIYILIPIVFTAYLTTGRSTFTWFLLGVMVVATVLRFVFFGMGAPHPVIWVTPFLRPESIILGILLSIHHPRWDWRVSAAIAVVAAAVFFSTPVPWASSWSNVVQYPTAAIMCAALVDTSLRSDVVRRVLASQILSALGTISFGLYVFHFWAIGLSARFVNGMVESGHVVGEGWKYALTLILTLAISVVFASISYKFFEKPFQTIKKRYSKVDGRAVIKNAQLEQGI